MILTTKPALSPLPSVDELLFLGRFAEARAVIDRALRAAPPDLSPTLRASCELRLALCDLAESRNKRALTSAGEAAAHFRELDDVPSEIAAQACQSVAAARLGHCFKAIESGLLATKLLNDDGGVRWSAQAYLALGHAYAWSQNPAGAIESFDQAARFAEQHERDGSVSEIHAARLWARLLRFYDADDQQAASPEIPHLVDLIESSLVSPSAESQHRFLPGLLFPVATTLEFARGLSACWQRDFAGAKVSADRLAAQLEAVRGWDNALAAWLSAEIARAEGMPAEASRQYEEMCRRAKAAEHEPLAELAQKLSANHSANVGQIARSFGEMIALRRQTRLLHNGDIERSVTRQIDERRCAISQRAEMAKFEHLANQDGLTDLANKRQLQLSLTHWAKGSKDSGEQLAAAVIDVDHFKTINDNYSHETGDRVLREIARIMREHVRSCDLPARPGGDEFVILFHGAPFLTARQISDRIERAVAEYEWSAIKPGLKVSISIGVAEALPDDTPESLMTRGDKEMYLHKRSRQQVRAVSQVFVERVARVFEQAERVVLFVGSGAVPTHSAIASRESIGSWRYGDRRRFGSVEGLREDPSAFLKFWAKRRADAEGTEPGDLHRAIVTLASLKPNSVLITESTEGLLSKAGAHDVKEIYGNVHKDRCVGCGATFSADETTCPKCCDAQAWRRPAITLLGEDPDYSTLASAELSAKRADVIVVINSDANILPGAVLLDKGRSRGATVVMLGVGPNTRCSAADICARADASLFVERLITRLQNSATPSPAIETLTKAGYATLNFLSGQGKDHVGRSVEHILNMTDEQIDCERDASAWLFPVLTPNRVFPDAPVLSRGDFAVLSSDDAAREGIRSAFRRMLKFYGFQWRNDTVERLDEGWERCFDRWASRASDHDQRISWLIESVSRFGLVREACSLVGMLKAELPHHRIDDATTPLSDWKLAASLVNRVDGTTTGT